MTDVTIYHNPRCSKSRQTLTLLQERGIEPDVVLYMDNPPSKKKLRELLKMMNLSARDLLRTSEDAYKARGLSDKSLSEDDLLDAMLEEPRLIQRPIVVSGGKAALGRPPENVLGVL